MAGRRGGRIDRSGGGNFLHELISRRNRLYTTLTFNLLNASPGPVVPARYLYIDPLFPLSRSCFFLNSRYINGPPRERGCPWRRAYCLFRLFASAPSISYIVRRTSPFFPVTWSHSRAYFRIVRSGLSGNLTRSRNVFGYPFCSKEKKLIRWCFLKVTYER